MAKQVLDINFYQPKSTEKFFFDANIWMFLLCPLGNYQPHIISKYDNFLKKIRKEKAPLFVSSLVLSEFFNAYVRLEFELWKKKDCNNEKYREFKKTQIYKELVSEASYVIKYTMLKIAGRVDDKFRDIDIEELFVEIENSDLNDNYHLDLALMEQMIFVTDDGNIPSQKIKSSILTGNPKLLAQNVS